MKKISKEEIIKDTFVSMDESYKELCLILRPVFHNKIKWVNGKLLKDCFKHIKNIILTHQYIRKYYQ